MNCAAKNAEISSVITPGGDAGVLRVDDTRATPAELKNNGIDFHPTDRRVLFGHHFAAIAAAGPLLGPVLAAQFGYLPGTLRDVDAALRKMEKGTSEPIYEKIIMDFIGITKLKAKLTGK